MSWYHYNQRIYMYGQQLTYKEADKKLRSIEKKYKRHWMRADYYSRWYRAKDAIDLWTGWRARPRHGSRLIRLYKDGRVAISANQDSAYRRYRANHYNPFNEKWWFENFRSTLFLRNLEEPRELSIMIKDVHYMVRRKKYSRYPYYRARYIYFDADGSLTYPLTGKTYQEYKKEKIKEANTINAPYKRGWYWLRQARNLHLDSSGCMHGGSYPCRSWRDVRVPPPRTLDCGCRIYRKKQRPFRKTVTEILEENNASVRAAWMQMYGISKFFQDAGSEVLVKSEDYELIRLKTPAHNVRALKMVCPSTGTIHVNCVPPTVWTINAALDWMFNVRGFSSMVGKQT